MATERDNSPVGYRKPPTRSQFEKGRSGNPRGRPRGAKNLSTLLGETLSEGVTVTENGRRRKITKLAAMCKRLVNEALAGNLSAMRLLLELIRSIENRGQSSEEAFTDKVDQELIRQLRERMQRTAQGESERAAKGGDNNDRSDPV